MDAETQIADKLKQTLPKPEFRDNEQPVPQPKDEIAESHNNFPLENALLKMQMFDFFNVPPAARNTTETTMAIEKILDWAHKQTGSRELADLLHVINRQEAVMGSRSKEDRLFRIYQYVKINQQMDALAEQAKSLYG